MGKEVYMDSSLSPARLKDLYTFVEAYLGIILTISFVVQIFAMWKVFTKVGEKGLKISYSYL